MQDIAPWKSTEVKWISFYGQNVSGIKMWAVLMIQQTYIWELNLLKNNYILHNLLSQMLLFSDMKVGGIWCLNCKPSYFQATDFTKLIIWNVDNSGMEHHKYISSTTNERYLWSQYIFLLFKTFQRNIFVIWSSS